MIASSFQSPLKDMYYSVFIIQSQKRKLNPLRLFTTEGVFYSELISWEIEEPEVTIQKWKLSQTLATGSAWDPQGRGTTGRTNITRNTEATVHGTMSPVWLIGSLSHTRPNSRCWQGYIPSQRF
jgi:hypothetical protein